MCRRTNSVAHALLSDAECYISVHESTQRSKSARCERIQPCFSLCTGDLDSNTMAHSRCPAAERLPSSSPVSQICAQRHCGTVCASISGLPHTHSNSSRSSIRTTAGTHANLVSEEASVQFFKKPPSTKRQLVTEDVVARHIAWIVTAADAPRTKIYKLTCPKLHSKYQFFRLSLICVVDVRRLVSARIALSSGLLK